MSESLPVDAKLALMLPALLAAGVAGSADLPAAAAPTSDRGAGETDCATGDRQDAPACDAAIAPPVAAAESRRPTPALLASVGETPPDAATGRAIAVPEGESAAALGRVRVAASWLLLASGLFPLATFGTLWLARRRVVQSLVTSVQQRLRELGDLESRVKLAQHGANRSIQELQDRVEQTKEVAAALIAELEAQVGEVRSAAEAELMAFRDDLQGQQKQSQQQLVELEKEFISNMQILASRADRQKTQILQEFTQRAPQELLARLQPQIQRELRSLVEQIATLQGQQLSNDAATEPQATIEKAESLFRAGQYEAALTEYERAIARDSDCYEAWLGKGVCLEMLQRFEAAIAAYDRATRIKPDNYEGWYNRGIVLGRLGKYEDAIVSYGQALILCPDNPDLWLHRGIALNKMQRYEAAVKAYTQASNLKPDSHEAWYNRANALVRLNRHREALEAYDKSLELNPKNGGAWHNRGVVLAKLGDCEGAIAAYDRALALDDNDAEAWYSRGNVLVRLDCYPEALESYERALAANDRHERARRNRAIVAERLSSEYASLGTEA